MKSLVQAIKKKIPNRLIIICLIVANSSAAGAQNGSLQVFDQKGKELWLYKESHALVIWAGDYQHWSKLNNIKDEVQELKEVLQMHRFVVKTLGNPDGKQLRQSIQDFLNNFGYQSDNRLVIFFAGHGWTRKNSKGYLVPVDAPDPAVSRKNEHEFLKIALDMEQFESWAKQIEAKHVLFVFDSCFSGLIFKKRSATDMPLYIESIKNKPVRQFLTAGDADQRVPAKSYFTPLFIRALQGEADIMKDGYVTGSELGLYLKQNLTVYTKEQTPQFGTIRDPGLDQGDIVFRVSQSKPSVAMRPSRPSYSPAMLKESISIARPTPRSGQRIRKEDPYVFGQEKAESFNASPQPVTESQELSLLTKSLSNRNHRDADIETKRLLLSADAANDVLSKKAIGSISCERLRRIDEQWTSYTKGVHGFSAQLARFPGSFRDFEAIVGWRRGGFLTKTTDQGKSQPPGYFPRAVSNGPIHEELLQRFRSCQR